MDTGVRVSGLCGVFIFCESMKTDNRHFNTNMTQSNPTVQRPQVNIIGQLQDEHILEIGDYRALLQAHRINLK